MANAHRLSCAEGHTTACNNTDSSQLQQPVPRQRVGVVPRSAAPARPTPPSSVAHQSSDTPPGSSATLRLPAPASSSCLVSARPPCLPRAAPYPPSRSNRTGMDGVNHRDSSCPCRHISAVCRACAWSPTFWSKAHMAPAPIHRARFAAATSASRSSKPGQAHQAA